MNDLQRASWLAFLLVVGMGVMTAAWWLGDVLLKRLKGKG